MHNVNTIAVYVGLDLVGDGLMKLPFARALRAAWPGAHITWIAGKGPSVFAGRLAPSVTGLIDEVIENAGIGSRWTELFSRPLSGRSFDLVIDTQRRVLTTLVLRRIRHRAFMSGAAGFALSSRRPARGYEKPPAMIRQMLDLIEVASGAPADTSAPLSLPPEFQTMATAILPAGPEYIGLAPGAGGRHKCWPLANFVALAKSQHAKGRTAVFILGPDELVWFDELRAAVPEALFSLQSPEAVHNTGQDSGTSPLLTIAMASRLAAAVANDSGGGHMLAAGGAPLVSLFGPTDPAKFAPYASRPSVIRAQDYGDNGMDAIPTKAVSDAIDALLADQPPEQQQAG